MNPFILSLNLNNDEIGAAILFVVVLILFVYGALARRMDAVDKGVATAFGATVDKLNELDTTVNTLVTTTLIGQYGHKPSSREQLAGLGDFDIDMPFNMVDHTKLRTMFGGREDLDNGGHTTWVTDSVGATTREFYDYLGNHYRTVITPEHGEPMVTEFDEPAIKPVTIDEAEPRLHIIKPVSLDKPEHVPYYGD